MVGSEDGIWELELDDCLDDNEFCDDDGRLRPAKSLKSIVDRRSLRDDGCGELFPQEDESEEMEEWDEHSVRNAASW